MFGYKSLQQNMHKDIWKWTNECFGLLTFVGSIIYIICSIILEKKDIPFSPRLNIYALVYLTICVVLTECYGVYKRYKNKKVDPNL